MSRLGLVSAGEANVSVSGGERLGSRLSLELLRLVPIPVVAVAYNVLLFW